MYINDSDSFLLTEQDAIGNCDFQLLYHSYFQQVQLQYLTDLIQVLTLNYRTLTVLMQFSSRTQ